MGTEPAHRLPGVEFGAAAPGQPRPLYRLERRSAASQYPVHCLQYAILDPALGRRAASGFAPPQPHGPAAVRRLGVHVRASDLLSGNFRRPGTISRDLLPGSQLGAAGAHHGARQGRSNQPAESFDQRSVGLSPDTAVSAVRHPPQSGWLDKWDRLKGGHLLSLGVALKRAFVNGSELSVLSIRSFLLADVLADLLQFKADRRDSVTAGPQMFTREIPLLPAQPGNSNCALPLQKSDHRSYRVL